MKVKDLVAKLSVLNQEDELFCISDDDEEFDGAKRAYQILDIQEKKGYKERMRTKNIDATFTECNDGVDTPLLIITSDF